MRYDEWRRANDPEIEFRKALEKLADIFQKICNSTGDDQEEYVRKMNNFQNSYAYEKFVMSSVKRMVTPIANQNARTWRIAARKASKSRTIYLRLIRQINEGLKQDIKDQIIENASLIRTLPNDVAQKVVKDIAKEALEGKRSTTIAKDIKDKTDQHARASARLIARTETSKTTTALCRARAENLGLDWYIWRTALDGDRVRKSHQIMEGVLVNWKNPPSPEELVGEPSVGTYHAGCIWNCRCYPEPVIDLDDVKWPAKVYYNGQIERMSRAKFETIG